MYPGNHSLPVHRDVPHSFLQLPNTPLCEWTIHSLFNKHSPIYGHLSYFQYFKVINNTAINILVLTYFWCFQGWFLEVGLLGQNKYRYFLLDAVQFFSTRFAPMYIPTSSVWGCLLAHSLTNRIYWQTLKFLPIRELKNGIFCNVVQKATLGG